MHTSVTQSGRWAQMIFLVEAYMSVIIFDISATDECTISIPVASEAKFNSLWEFALKELGISRLGNGVWLQKNDLELILFDFSQIKEWAEQYLPPVEADYVVNHINYIMEELPSQWNGNPHITELWMG
jgi:hypothetical protein